MAVIRRPPVGLAVAITIASLIMCSPECRAEQNVGTLEAGVLQVCLYPGFAPFSSKDSNGEWVGWDVDFLKDFAAGEGLRFQPVEVDNFDGIWNQPARDTCDIAASGISDTPDRRATTDASTAWSAHYYSVLRALLVRSADEHNLSRIEDLQNRTVIVTENSTADNDLRIRLTRAGISSTTILNTTDESEAAQQVLAGGNGGEPFAYAGGLGSMQYLAAQLDGVAVAWPHCRMLADGSEVGEPFSFVVRTASSGVLPALDGYIADPVTPYAGRAETAPDCQPAP